ncbi:MAG: hypothetical protein GF320_17000 [Armatimonadia bacterium]|nr:hypothetical protein [Armatimonadia bacterium]
MRPATRALLEEMLRTVRSGATAVVCEGAAHGFDQNIYNHWFGGGRAVRFFGHSGCGQVRGAVAELSPLAELTFRVVGLVDGDFLDAEVEETDAPPIRRLPRPSIENYLLEPSHWHAVIDRAWRLAGAPPEGWRTQAEVAQRLEEHCRECVPITAHNRCVQIISEEFARSDERRYIRYLEYSDQDLGVLLDQLRTWTSGFGAHERLAEIWATEMSAADRCRNVEELARYVFGKPTFRRWARKLPLTSERSSVPLDYVLNSYADVASHPPAELAQFMDSILSDP